MIRIHVIEAQGLAADPSTASPYTLIAAGQDRLKSQLGQGSDPVWQEAFDVRADCQKVYVTIWDKRHGQQDAFLGLASVDFDTIPLDGSQQWFQLVGRKGKNDVVSGEICVSCQNVEEAPAPLMKVQGPPGKPAKNPKQSDREAKQKVNDTINAGANEIDLSGLELAAVPEALSSYHEHWVNIDLGFNKFTIFPIALSVFNALEELCLTGNQICAIPADIHIPTLRILYLNGNQLKSLPDCITSFVSLEKLDLANNQISQITPSLGDLKKLAELIMTGNPLSTVPPSIGKLEYLEILDLSSCELVSLPQEFPGMGRLLDLNLGNNQLTKLPTEFGNMSRIVSLNLCDNKLTDLPVSMGSCSHLDSVILDRNPIQDEELLRKYEIGTDHLLDYLSKKLFAQTQAAKKKQKDAARKAAATKLREDMKKESSVKGGTQDAATSTFNLEDEGFVEEVDEDEDAKLTPEERYAKLRATSQKLAVECRNEVITLKRALFKANTKQEILPIAKAISNLIPHMNVARQQMAPIPKPQPPLFTGKEDKDVQLKKTTVVALREFETVLNGIFNVVSGNATLEQLVPLSGVITGCLSILQATTKSFPSE